MRQLSRIEMNPVRLKQKAAPKSGPLLKAIVSVESVNQVLYQAINEEADSSLYFALSLQSKCKVPT
jgi:hypothetical protein